METALSMLTGVVDKALPIASLIAKIAGGVALLALAFLAFQMISGKGASLAPATASNIKLAASIFGWMAILAALGGIFVIWEQKGAGLAVTAIGVALYFGLPILLAKQFGVGNQNAAIWASTQLAEASRVAGFGVTIVGLLKYLIEIVVWLVEMPERMRQKADVGRGQHLDVAQQRVAREANMFSPCWSLPFCREVIRKQCPAYLARKTCWKFKRGCYCDDEMIGRIIRGDSIEKIKAPTRMSQLRKPPCGRCYIYLEHQTHKFKMMSPLAVPLTIILMFFIWQPFSTVFDPAYRKVDNWQRSLNLFESPNPVEASAQARETVKKLGEVDQEQVVFFTRTFVLMMIGFFALIYISRFIEWAIFDAKL